MKFIIGQKMEMSQIFKEDGDVVPVTRVIAGPCLITKKLNYPETNGKAIQIAWQETSEKELSKSIQGFFKKILGRSGGYKLLKEFRLPDNDPMFDKLAVGQELDASIFSVGDIVKVQGRSKGKGFQGVVKRYDFAGHPKTHGHKDQLRMPGAIGAGGLQRVIKGMRMGGHMGDEAVTVLNLEVAAVNPEKNEIYFKGAVPGARNGVLFIKAPGNFEVKNKKEIAPVEMAGATEQAAPASAVSAPVANDPAHDSVEGENNKQA